MMKLGILILAAGEGTRMRSRLPKVLHKLAGRPLLSHVIEAARRLAAAKIVIVYGHGGEQVPAQLGSEDLLWCEQAERLGTGHAVMQGLPLLHDMDRVLILYGDVPLISDQTLAKMLSSLEQTDLVVLTAEFQDPTGYGRIVRDATSKVVRIIEQKDATTEELAIREINSGIMAVERSRLENWLSRIRNQNAQQEYYLTDIIALAVEDGVEVQCIKAQNPHEIQGVNDRRQLAEMERRLQRRLADELMLAGVTLADPSRIDIRGVLQAGRDVSIDCNVIFEGRVVLADGVRIGPNVVIKDAVIGENVQIFANSVLDSCEVGANALIGPFARIRPESVLGNDVHIGNFVEIKKSQVAARSKINHLSYVGDSRVGRDVNIGAGVITCNYDGANKHQTVIGDNVFVGSDCQLVAPVTLGDGATIGAGSTITRNAPDGKLTLSRVKQFSLDGWQRPVKKK